MGFEQPHILGLLILQPLYVTSNCMITNSVCSYYRCNKRRHDNQHHSAWILGHGAAEAVVLLAHILLRIVQMYNRGAVRRPPVKGGKLEYVNPLHASPQVIQQLVACRGG
jgi:hypothetical protein